MVIGGPFRPAYGCLGPIWFGFGPIQLCLVSNNTGSLIYRIHWDRRTLMKFPPILANEEFTPLFFRSARVFVFCVRQRRQSNFPYDFVYIFFCSCKISNRSSSDTGWTTCPTARSEASGKDKKDKKDQPMASRGAVLSLYKRLHRTAQTVFAGDQVCSLSNKLA